MHHPEGKMSFAKRLCLFTATGFGIGAFAPFAPGTFGSAPGVALAFATTLMPVWAQLLAALALAAAAVPVCSVAERLFGVKDDGRITADEWMLFPLAVTGLPLAALPWWATAVFFTVVRFVDIVKPAPARRLQAVRGGLGIVIDDFVANLYSLAANWAIYIWLFK